ncbi:flagellar motor switch protein FliN [Hippea sp. KM1]|uniref:flagellar motor switch protein FliN n=1 Tax=Hippea sp. KM1 TaxID=944481 RepID=UPI0004A7CF85|nr:flagellar motor switch protein FliN [Hippea sp. KM1]
MVAEELSQDEIDSLLGGADDSAEEDNSSNQEVNGDVKTLFDLLNASIEEVMKTAFSLEVVSKFIDLSIVGKDDISLDDKVLVEVDVSNEGGGATLFLLLNKKFASILSDLMLMGPGQAKDDLEPEDLDALKELFSQVFGQLSTQVKESLSPLISFDVKQATKEVVQLEGDSFYKTQYDIAIPNVENDIVEVVSPKDALEGVFAQHEEETPEQEPVEIPFKDVEEEPLRPSGGHAGVSSAEAPKNLDLIMDIDLDVKIRIGQKNMLIKDILDLKDGSIIELDKNIEEPMDILVNGKVVAQGIVVVVGGKFGVKITHIETREERIKSLGE